MSSTQPVFGPPSSAQSPTASPDQTSFQWVGPQTEQTYEKQQTPQLTTPPPPIEGPSKTPASPRLQGPTKAPVNTARVFKSNPTISPAEQAQNVVTNSGLKTGDPFIDSLPLTRPTDSMQKDLEATASIAAKAAPPPSKMTMGLLRTFSGVQNVVENAAGAVEGSNFLHPVTSVLENMASGALNVAGSTLRFGEMMGIGVLKKPADNVGAWSKTLASIPAQRTATAEAQAGFQTKYGKSGFVRTAQNIQKGADDVLNGLGIAGGGLASFYIPGVGISKGTQVLSTVSPIAAAWFGGSATGFLFGASEAGSVYEEAQKMGATKQEAAGAGYRAFAINAVLGAITARFGILSPETSMIKRGLTTMTTNALQGFLQTVTHNVLLHQKWDNGALQSATVGGILGLIGGAASGEFSKEKSQEYTPAQQAQDQLATMHQEGLVSDEQMKNMNLDPKALSENRLLQYKGGQEGTPGIDYSAEPPKPLADDTVRWMQLYTTDQLDPGENPTGAMLKELAPYKPKEPVTLYRGDSGEGENDSLAVRSWTHDLSVAEKFAGENGTVYKETVDPKDIVFDSTTAPPDVTKHLQNDFEKEVIVKSGVEGQKFTPENMPLSEMAKYPDLFRKYSGIEQATGAEVESKAKAEGREPTLDEYDNVEAARVALLESSGGKTESLPASDNSAKTNEVKSESESKGPVLAKVEESPLKPEDQKPREDLTKITPAEHETFKKLTNKDIEYLQKTVKNNIAKTETTKTGTITLNRLQDEGLVKKVAENTYAPTQKGRTVAELSTKYLPPDLAPTKAPNEDTIYGKNFSQTTYKGQDVTTNGYILEFNKVQDQPYLGSLQRKTLDETSTGRLIDSFANQKVAPLNPIAYYRDDNMTVLSTENGKKIAADNAYINYFKKKYPGAEFFGPTKGEVGAEKPIIVRSKGKDIGYIMPIRMKEEATPLKTETQETLPTKRIAKEIKQAVKNEKAQTVSSLPEGALRVDSNLRTGEQVYKLKDKYFYKKQDGTIEVHTKQSAPTPKQLLAVEPDENSSYHAPKRVFKTGAEEPPKPPKPPERRLGQEPPPKPKESKLRITKQPPRPLEEAQPQRTSRLRSRLEQPNEAKPEPTKPGIRQYLEKELTAQIRKGSTQGHPAIFKSLRNLVRIRESSANNVTYITHEVGHYLDQELGLVSSLRQKGVDKNGGEYFNYSEPYRSELLGLANDPEGLSSAKSPGASLEKKMKEGVAEFTRLYVTDPSQLAERTPAFLKHFESAMPAEALRVLKESRTAYKEAVGATPEARVKAQISTEVTQKPLMPRAKQAVARFFEAVDDDLRPLRKFTEQVEAVTGKEMKFKNDPYVLARLTRGLDGKANQWLMPNLKPLNYDLTFNENARSLGSILRDVTNESDFEAYLVSKRALDLQAREIATGIAPDDAKSVIATMENRHPEFPKLQKEIVNWNKSILQYARDGGFISEDHLNKMLENGANYVPFHRVIDEAEMKGLGKKFGDIMSPIKKIKGSGREIISPIESMVKNAYSIISAVDRNDVGRSVVAASNLHPDLGALVEPIPAPVHPIEITAENLINQLGLEPDVADQLHDVVTFFARGGRPGGPGENTMQVMTDGKPKYFVLEPNLYRSMSAMSRENAGLLMRILATPASVLRAGATLTPEFLGRNPFRDQRTAFLYSRANYLPFIDLAKGVKEMISRSDDYQRAAAGGAMQSAFVSLDRPGLQKRIDRMFASRGEQVQHYFLHPLDAVRALSEYGEVGTRVGEARKVFAKEMKQSGDYKEAVLRSSFAARNVTIDFARMGYAGKTANMITAFWNANVQDVSKLFREFTGQEKGANPMQTLLKSVASLTVPSVGLYLLSKDDKRYQDLPRWQKDYFDIIAIPGVPLIRIPKPFLPGMIFSSFPTRLLEATEKKSMQPLNDYFTSLQQTSVPGIAPTALLPLLEWQANYSFFFGAKTVPDSEQTLLPADQYGVFTPEIYKKIGALTNTSPRKLATFVYGYGAGLSTYAANFVDTLGGKFGLLPDKAELPTDPANIPILKAFLISDLSSQSQAVSDYYTKYNQSFAAYRSLGQAAAEQNVARMKEIGNKNLNDLIYLKSDGKPEFIYHALLGVSKAFSDMRKVRDAILTSKLSPDDKRDKLLLLNTTMRDLALKALDQTKNTYSSPADLLKALSESKP